MALPYRTYSFEKLEAWQLAREIKLEIYIIVRNFPKEELFGLASQYRRSIDSVSTNLSEGSGRASNVDKAHFTNISYSSCLESINHTISAMDLNYINEQEYINLRVKLDNLIAKLSGLYKYQLNAEQPLKSKFVKK